GELRPVAPGGGRPRALARDAGHHRPALTGLRLVRHVRQLRTPRRDVQENRGKARLMSRTQLRNGGPRSDVFNKDRREARAMSAALRRGASARPMRPFRALETVGADGGGAALAPLHYT